MKKFALLFMCFLSSIGSIRAQALWNGKALVGGFFRHGLMDSLVVDSLSSQQALKFLESLNHESDSIKQRLDSLTVVATDTIPALGPAEKKVVATDTIAAYPDTLATDSTSLKVQKQEEEQKPVVMKKKKRTRRINPIFVRIDSIGKSYRDSLHLRAVEFHAHLRLWDNLDLPAPKHIRPNPDYWKLIVPPTYYTGVIDQAFGMNWSPETRQAHSASDSLYQVKAVQPYQVADLCSSKKVDRWLNEQFLTYYMEHPEMVTGNEVYMKDLTVLNDEQLEVKKRKEKIVSFLKPEEPVASVEESEILVLKPNFWTQEGNGYAQFTQQYISDNWYQGGESTVSMLSGCMLKARYDDHQRLEWENSLELKLGFVTAPSDTVHSYRTNADLFRLNSKLGVRAVKNWYYTLATELKTQFFANYRTNSNRRNSDFLSPLQLTVNLGMDFKQKKPKYDISVLASPFAYTLVYIHSDKIDNPGAFNVEEGKRSANMFGSKVTANVNWKILPSVTWQSMFEYFTTYEKVIASWENTINFTLNRYISAKLFLHARYDDGVTLDEENHSYFQFQQLLSIGLNYTW